MDIAMLIEAGQEHTFYTSMAWERVRQNALKRDHYECQRCRAKGKLTKAVIVHHIKHLKDRPDLALCLDDPETGEKQLTSLCKACHEEEHPERFPQNNPKEPLTIERWD